MAALRATLDPATFSTSSVVVDAAGVYLPSGCVPTCFPIIKAAEDDLAALAHSRAGVVEDEVMLRGLIEVARTRVYDDARALLAAGAEPWQVRSMAVDDLYATHGDLDDPGSQDERTAEIMLEAVDDAVCGRPLGAPPATCYPADLAARIADAMADAAWRLGERFPASRDPEELWGVVAG
jgi:hypothetical protein